MSRGLARHSHGHSAAVTSPRVRSTRMTALSNSLKGAPIIPGSAGEPNGNICNQLHVLCSESVKKPGLAALGRRQTMGEMFVNRLLMINRWMPSSFWQWMMLVAQQENSSNRFITDRSTGNSDVRWAPIVTLWYLSLIHI